MVVKTLSTSQPGQNEGHNTIRFYDVVHKNAALQSSVWMSNCTKKFPEYSGWFLISRAAVFLLEGFKIQELCILSTCGKIKFIQK